MTAEGRTGAELRRKFKCLRGEAKRCKGEMQDSSSEGGIGIPRAEAELLRGRCGARTGCKAQVQEAVLGIQGLRTS